MSKLTFTPLTKLRPYKNNRQVQVKCLHSWQQKNTFWRGFIQDDFS
ncbi:unnamed protein product [Brassica rapa]|uniref:Uncharacterized protein n=2 Tax=Brassica TaxID=3705 RepID=A0A3P5YV47_BRACM|nr:unnamed protein product [Brassica napus]CAG7876501.1 unnamed protein product [Brassica rapa]VDC71652.1 unnamed protein product [Brassica rapa]